VFQRVPIALSKDTASSYEEMRDLMQVSLANKYATREDLRAHATNALSQMMKLRQITAGYVPAFPEQWIGASSDDAKVLVPIGREKIDWLLDHCETVNERIVVWTQFVYEAARYSEALRERQTKRDPWQFSCATITGLTKESDRPEVFQGFVRGDFQVLIAHPGVAQWGVSFPGVSLAAYGSLSYALQEFAQSQDRIHGIGRGDLTKHSTYYLLTATANGAATIDDDCVDVLDGKRSTLDIVFNIDRERRESGFVARDVGQRIGP
jgi:superfamily II DNA or RNA helicase